MRSMRRCWRGSGRACGPRHGRCRAWRRPEPRAVPDVATQALAGLITRRRQLIEMLVAERQRLAQAPPTGPVTRDLRTHIRWLQRRLLDVDDDIGHAIQASPVWRV